MHRRLVLPYDFVDFADTVQKYTKDLEKLLGDKQDEIRERNQELDEGAFKATFDAGRPLLHRRKRKSHRI
jgi:N-acetylated-alpha-linked acidic dipeptidase